MRVALVQLMAGEDKAANLARLQGLVAAAADGGAALVVAPEAAMHDFGPPERRVALVAEPLDGRFVAGVAQIAAQRRVTVLAGMFEAVAGEPDLAYNTVVAVGPDGELIGSYRKQHLFDALGWQESAKLRPGDPQQRLCFGCEDFTVGVLTCYDLRFPELARALVDDGATLLAVPSAWVAGPQKERQWSVLTAARAVENVCYVAAADQSAPGYAGGSCLVDPFGVVVASLGEGEGVTVADASVSRLLECRERMPSLEHRRWSVTPR